MHEAAWRGGAGRGLGDLAAATNPRSARGPNPNPFAGPGPSGAEVAGDEPMRKEATSTLSRVSEETGRESLDEADLMNYVVGHVPGSKSNSKDKANLNGVAGVVGRS